MSHPSPLTEQKDLSNVLKKYNQDDQNPIIYIAPYSFQGINSPTCPASAVIPSSKFQKADIFCNSSESKGREQDKSRSAVNLTPNFE